MKGRFYDIIRDLHLYFGLFMSPFLVVFALSTIVLNHRLDPEVVPSKSTAVVELDSNGESAMEQAHQVMDQLGISGDITAAALPPGQNRLGFVSQKPGQGTQVNVDLETKEATITVRNRGFLGALVDLHVKPGMHRSQRMINWIFLRLWSWLADATVYLVLFLAVSGVYLWVYLKAERTVGLVILGLGTLSFILAIAGLLSARAMM